MSTSKYLLLIENALQYLKDLLPPKEPLPKPPPLPKKEKTLLTQKPPFSPPKLLLKQDPELSPLPPPEKCPEEFLKLEPPRPRLPLSLEKARTHLQQIDPALPFCATIPSDSQAKQIKEGWKERTLTPAIPILFQGLAHRTLMTHLAKAIDTVYGSCRVVDLSAIQCWDAFLEAKQLKLILVPDKILFETQPLLSLYREIPQKKARTLGEIPLLLLPDLSLYVKDPSLKRSLWTVICTTLDSLPSS